jgi:hypothetical protein
MFPDPDPARTDNAMLAPNVTYRQAVYWAVVDLDDTQSLTSPEGADVDIPSLATQTRIRCFGFRASSHPTRPSR